MEVTTFKRVGQSVPPPRPQLPGHHVPSAVLCILTYAAASQDCSSASKPGVLWHYWDGPLDNNAQVCEFGGIFKIKNCGISPLNAVPRGSIISFPTLTPLPEELPRKVFPRKLNCKTVCCTKHLYFETHLSKSCVFTSLLKSRWF